MISATGAQAQSAPAAEQATSELPELVVETSKKPRAAKKKPTSEPQAPVTQDTSPAADPEAPVVFSANRTPTDAAKVGSSVSVITEKDIDAQSKTFLQDYLQQVPGVNVVTTGGVGSQTTFRMRGLNQNYIKVLVDGMDLSDPSGTQTSTRLEHLMVGDTAQIEVLKGSQSTLYGGDAVAGVISLDTKFARQPGLFQSGGGEYGTYNTWRGAYTAGYADANGSNVAFTVQSLETDGFSAARLGTEDDGYKNLTFSGRGEYKVSDEVTVFFAARSLDAQLEYDSSGVDRDNVVDTVQQAGRVGANVSLLGGRFVNTFAIQGMQTQRDAVEPPFTSWFDGDRIKGEYRGTFSFNERLAIVSGVDWEQLGFESMFDARQSVDITSPYAQLIVEPIDGLVLTGGGRIDNHSLFGEYDTHRLTAAYLVPKSETKFHASYGTGFRAPSLYELYSFSGNTNFVPETSVSWDVGVDQGFMGNRYGVGATYFQIDIDNLITFDNFNFIYQQLPGTTHNEGVELTAFAKLTPTTIISAGYTYTESTEPDGTRSVRLPRHNLALGFSARPIDKTSININGLYVADSIDGVFAPFPVFEKQKVDDFFLLSAKVGYEVLPGATAYVRGENLLDEDYVTAIGYNNPGLTVFGGVQFALPAN
ncbi:MAG: TonB-dependent receptor [Hyphomicrobium sp.]|uniref:TonB-dependent receptor plug domain-containing protein n=1 Tax=Hyphomicrobium sp. TaxID=82 RepID=UPI0013227906|nr:TonB-dependent receptor [Hyphomicrobium sp.]KAB2939977.1 MAG: TonB-dependent receptor [Hyphomicrobium sp.]MBZ0209913.1 TonB-dependent receptor [Hyphomicrobium sp.]